MPSLEEQIEELRRAPTNNAVALFLHSLLPWNAPNAPAEAAETQTLLERALALLGARPGAAPRDRHHHHDDDDEDEGRNNADEHSSTEE